MIIITSLSTLECLPPKYEEHLNLVAFVNFSGGIVEQESN